MDWVIRPLIGLGPLRLGMRVSDVAEILDPLHPVTDRSQAFDGSISEHRGLEVPVCSYDGDVLRGVDTTWHVKNVVFDGVNVYQSKSKDIMMKLAIENGGAKYGLGILLFQKFSVTSNGFFYGNKGFYPDGFDGGQDERTLSVYRMHVFDAALSHFEDVDLSKYK